MYNLVEQGIFTYANLGIAILPGGAFPAHVIAEHIEIRSIYGQAQQEKAQLDSLSSNNPQFPRIS